MRIRNSQFDSLLPLTSSTCHVISRAVQGDESATAEVLDRERRAHRREVAALHAAKDEAFTSLRKVLERVKRDAAASAT